MLRGSKALDRCIPHDARPLFNYFRRRLEDAVTGEVDSGPGQPVGEAAVPMLVGASKVWPLPAWSNRRLPQVGFRISTPHPALDALLAAGREFEQRTEQIQPAG